MYACVYIYNYVSLCVKIFHKNENEVKITVHKCQMNKLNYLLYHIIFLMMDIHI